MIRRRLGLFAALLVSAAVIPATAQADSTFYVGNAADGCPNAQTDSLTSAVALAQPRDIIRICPGTYMVGPTGTTATGAGLQGLLIDKTLTIIGAGANKVTIEPSEDLADPTNAADNFRDALGNVITVEQVPNNDPGDSSDFDVNPTISGVTISNGGHYVDAGIEFNNAAGTISSSTITPDTAYTGPNPGTPVTPNYGWGVVASNNYAVTPQGAFTRDVTVSGNTITTYGGGGVLVDGSEASKPIYFRSGVSESAAISGNVITGTAGQVQQYGVQVNAGARAAITNNAITANVGTTAGTDTNPGTGVGILLTDADVTSTAFNSTTPYTKMTGNNLTGNGYGLFNGTADFPAAAASDANARKNGVGTATYPIEVNGTGTTPTDLPTLTNTAMGGTVNYDTVGVKVTSGSNYYGPTPETAGQPSTTGGDGISESTVGGSDSAVYNSAPSATLVTPTKVTDAPPTVSWATPDGVNQTTLVAGQADELLVLASDDFGVSSVDITANGTDLGTLTAPPYEVSYTPPTSMIGQPVTLIATATDEANQVTTATLTVTVSAPPAPPASTPPASTPTTLPASTPPASTPPSTPTSTPAATPVSTPAGVTAAPKITLGSGVGSATSPLTALSLKPGITGDVTKVVYALDGKVICTATRAPYTCNATVTPDEVGTDTLSITATGPGGSTLFERLVHISTNQLTFTKAGFKVTGLTGSVELKARTTAWLNTNHEIQGYVALTVPAGSKVTRKFIVKVYVNGKLAGTGTVTVAGGKSKLFTLRVAKGLTFKRGTKVSAIATYAPAKLNKRVITTIK